MRKQQFQNEPGQMTINGEKMSWVIRRTKNQSAFGLRGSRIFYLILHRDGRIIGEYNKGWKIGCMPDKEDETANLCISYLVDRYGREAPRKKREMGHIE